MASANLSVCSPLGAAVQRPNVRKDLRENLCLVLNTQHILTKREILKVIRSLFDSLFMPDFSIFFKGKVITQEIWASGLGSGDSIGEQFVQTWRQWVDCWTLHEATSLTFCQKVPTEWCFCVFGHWPNGLFSRMPLGWIMINRIQTKLLTFQLPIWSSVIFPSFDYSLFFLVLIFRDFIKDFSFFESLAVLLFYIEAGFSDMVT